MFRVPALWPFSVTRSCYLAISCSAFQLFGHLV